jgi:putative hemolysin
MHGGPVETTTVEDGKTKTICVAPETDVPSRPSPEDAVKCKPKEVPDAFGGPNCDGCNDTHPLSQKSAYKAAVREFCRSERTAEQGYKDPQKWSATLDVFIDRGQEDPDTKLPPICARYNQMWEHSTDWPDSEKYCKAKGTWDGNSVFRVTVIPKEDQSDCKDIADYKLPKGDKCEEKLNAIVDKCIAGEKDDETGGYYYDSNSNGCWEWWIWSKTDINLKE